MTAFRDFWDVPVEDVAVKTGAASVMDCSDIQDVLTNLGLDLSDKRVIDVGCGTGRLHKLCGDYFGYDIAPGMVMFAATTGLNVRLMTYPQDVTEKGDVVCCLSVFTHIPRVDRCVFLRQFRKLAKGLLVDILPAEQESGGIAASYTPAKTFGNDLIASGWLWHISYERVSPDGALHRYYLAS